MGTTLADDEIIERLSRIEHDQWTTWSRSVAAEVSPERLSVWQASWVPYDALSDEQKELDRQWARRVLAAIRGA
jgi:hypothetical protein